MGRRIRCTQFVRGPKMLKRCRLSRKSDSHDLAWNSDCWTLRVLREAMDSMLGASPRKKGFVRFSRRRASPQLSRWLSPATALFPLSLKLPEVRVFAISVMSIKWKVAELMRRALFTVMPSECYERPAVHGTRIDGGRNPTCGISSRWTRGTRRGRGRHGVLVPPSDPAALAAAMRAISADKHRASEMGSTGMDPRARAVFARNTDQAARLTLRASPLLVAEWPNREPLGRPGSALTGSPP